MVSLTNTFVFMSNILNFTLFVSKPHLAGRCFILLDYDGNHNDSWPSQWKEMNVYSTNVCKIDVKRKWNGVFLEHKIKYYFPDRNQWLIYDDWNVTIYNSEILNNLIYNNEIFFYINLVLVLAFSLFLSYKLLIPLLYERCLFNNVGQ